MARRSATARRSSHALPRPIPLLRRVVPLSLLIALLASFGGCNATQLASSWKSPQYTAPDYTKVLIIALGKRTDLRRIYEDDFVQQLAPLGVQGVQGYTLLPDETDRVDKAALHRKTIELTGVGTHYGDHSSFHKMTKEEKAAWISSHAKPGIQPHMPKQSSCIDWALECVVAAYQGVGRGEGGGQEQGEQDGRAHSLRLRRETGPRGRAGLWETV